MTTFQTTLNRINAIVAEITEEPHVADEEALFLIHQALLKEASKKHASLGEDLQNHEIDPFEYAAETAAIRTLEALAETIAAEAEWSFDESTNHVTSQANHEPAPPITDDLPF